MLAMAFRNALRENNIAKVQQIIDESGNHHQSYHSMLDDAINSGHQEIVELLLDKGNCDVNERNSSAGTPLHSAVLQLCKSASWTNIVVKMFEKEAYFRLQDNDGNTPVHLAFLSDASGEVIDFLLKLYVKSFGDESKDFNEVFEMLVLQNGRVNKDGLNIYYIACTRPDLDVLKTLAAHGFVDNGDRVPLTSKCAYASYKPLHFAVASRQSEVVTFLLDGGANVYVTDKNASTPLHFALQRGDSELIELLLPYFDADRDMIDKFGYTHFMAACTSKEAKYVEEYLQVAAVEFPNLLAVLNEQQVNPIATLPFAGFTPLHFAVVGGNHEIVKILLKNGAEFYAQDINGTTPLHLALYIREEAMIQCLLRMDTVLMDVADVFGISHFMAACAAAPQEIIEEFLRVAEIRLESSQKSLINAKVKNDAPVYAGYTPLHFAVEFGNYEVVKLLLDRDADLYEQDVDGSTPLHLALENGDTMMIDLILEYDGLTENVVNNYGLSHFMAACASSELAFVKEYLRVSNLRSSISSSPLSSSSSFSSSSSSLIDSKTNECPHWYSGYSSIHFAAQFERVETVEFLLICSTESRKLGLTKIHEDVKKLLDELEDYENFMNVDDACGGYDGCEIEKELVDFNSNMVDWENMMIAM